MADYLERYYEFIAEWLRDIEELPVAKVVDVEENSYGGNKEYDLAITYIDHENKTKVITREGKLVDLLRNA